MKKGLISLIRETQIITAMSYHLPHKKLALIERTKPSIGVIHGEESSFTLVQSFGKTVEFPFHPTVPFLGIYSRGPKAILKRYLHSFVHCTCVPRTGDWIKNLCMVHIHSRVLLDHKAKSCNLLLYG